MKKFVTQLIPHIKIPITLLHFQKCENFIFYLFFRNFSVRLKKNIRQDIPTPKLVSLLSYVKNWQ